MRSHAVHDTTRTLIMTQNHNFSCAFPFLLSVTTSLVCMEQITCCCLNGQVLWLPSIKTSPSSMYMGRERKKNNEYSTWWKFILLICLSMSSNILPVEAIRLSIKYGSLTEPAFDLIFPTIIPVIQYSNQGILYFAKTAAQTWKTFLLKLFLHA